MQFPARDLTDSMANPLHYLATPLTHQDPRVEFARVEEAVQYCGHLVRSGRIVYSPVVANWWLRDLKNGNEWLQYDLEILDRCDILLIALMDCWQESCGALEEISSAWNKGIPVLYCKLVEMPNQTVGIAVDALSHKLLKLPGVRQKQYLELGSGYTPLGARR